MMLVAYFLYSSPIFFFFLFLFVFLVDQEPEQSLYRITTINIIEYKRELKNIHQAYEQTHIAQKSLF